MFDPFGLNHFVVAPGANVRHNALRTELLAGTFASEERRYKFRVNLPKEVLLKVASLNNNFSDGLFIKEIFEDSPDHREYERRIRDVSPVQSLWVEVVRGLGPVLDQIKSSLAQGRHRNPGEVHDHSHRIYATALRLRAGWEPQLH